MVECFLEWGTDENSGAGAQERKGMKEVRGKKEESYLLIREVNIERHPTRLKIRLLPRVV